MVDDSIVRGNTSKKIIQLARSAGANKVYFASCSPPINHPCVYGIDMSTKQELISRDKQVREICDQIGADHLVYATLQDTIEAVQEGNPDVKKFCHACFSGDYPTHISPETFTAIERQRLGIE